MMPQSPPPAFAGMTIINHPDEAPPFQVSDCHAAQTWTTPGLTCLGCRPRESTTICMDRASSVRLS